MIDRVQFFQSVNGIQSPDIIANFFDHFIVLKSLVEDHGSVEVDYNKENTIAFSIDFKDKSIIDEAIAYIKSTPNIMIYGRFISVNYNILTDNKIQIILT